MSDSVFRVNYRLSWQGETHYGEPTHNFLDAVQNWEHLVMALDVKGGGRVTLQSVDLKGNRAKILDWIEANDGGFLATPCPIRYLKRGDYMNPQKIARLAIEQGERLGLIARG